MDEREMLEAFAACELQFANFETEEDGSYLLPRIQFAWMVWQAGRRTAPNRECEWKCDDIDNGIWESACGESRSFIDGGPVENRMLFCHRCGGKLKTAPAGDKGGA